MKKMNKIGFTIVELVIVIAVIAILSAVMIPTFSGIVNKSKKSAALQEANNAKTTVLAEMDGDLFQEFDVTVVDNKGTDDTSDDTSTTTTWNYTACYFINNGYWFTINDGVIEACDKPASVAASANDKVYAAATTQDVVTGATVTVLEDLSKDTVVWLKAEVKA